MSNRIEKVNSLLEHEISKIILRDFYFSGSMITLTHVDCSANLFEAKVYVSVYPEKDVDKIIGVLNSGAHSVQEKINKIFKMRPVPRIHFFRDMEIAKAGKIEGLLSQLKKEEK